MRAVNSRKPVNVLAGFIMEWIRGHRDDPVPPFDTFEPGWPAPVTQRDVERWLLNCNYAYYRVGFELLRADALPDDGEAAAGLASALARVLKTISDTNPLKLRSKGPEALARELAKDWPPFCGAGRNDLDRACAALDGLGASLGEGDPRLRRALPAARLALVAERRVYREIWARAEAAPDALDERCRELVPLWCLVPASPLFTLTLWSDRAAVTELASRLAQAFREADPGFAGTGARESYTGLVAAAQRSYLDGLAHAAPAEAELDLVGARRLLGRAFFELGREPAAGSVPGWLHGKALLIWNTAVCSILGPRHLIRPAGPARTETALAPSRFPAADGAPGEALLRRVRADGSRETVAAIDLSLERETRAWKVVGSAYDANARVPAHPLLGDDRAVASSFLATNRYDAAGALTEGRGDSRYHALISVEVGADGCARLVLEDLGSKNGTCVVRREDGGARCLVLRSRRTGDAAAWAARTGVPARDASLVDRVALRRGDFIRFAGSCFEIA